MIEIRDLVKVYEGNTAVEGLCLEVAAGEVVGLVGPNGAGKTTTLRCLAGILPPTSGSIRVAGFDIREQSVEARRRLSFVPDEAHLFEHLTAWDFLTVIARLYGVSDGKERAERLLDDMGLSDKRHAFPGELSRGMKQKLVIAAALLPRPEALVLDEPLTGLDPRAMRRTKDLIVETARQGVSVLVSSHMLRLVEEICGRIAILHRGHIVLDGSLDEIRGALPDLDESADLEDVFLRATEEGA